MGYRSIYICCQRYRVVHDRSIQPRQSRKYLRAYYLLSDGGLDVRYPDRNKFRPRTAVELLFPGRDFSYGDSCDIGVRIPIMTGVHQMNRRAIGASVLGALMALACVVPASAQSDRLSDNGVEFRIGENESLVTTATITDKFIWAGISLIRPDSRHKPVPLYGYRASDLQDEEVLRIILPGIVNGTVRTAKITPSPSGEGEYRGRAILYSGEGNHFQSEEEWEYLLAAWRTVTSTETSGSDDLIALSRPIRDNMFRVFGDGEIPPMHELITGQELWVAGSRNDPSPGGREPVANQIRQEDEEGHGD